MCILQNDNQINTAQLIADAAIAFQRDCTGVTPASVTDLLGEQTLVVRLHDALSGAEKLLAQTSDGAAFVGEYHRRLFETSAASLHNTLHKILGVEVRESTLEIEPATGRVVEVLPCGDLIQVFRLSGGVGTQSWSSRSGSDGHQMPDKGVVK
jgi:uncharacterized protein YbcI